MICPFSSLPGILRGKLRVVTDLQEASSANWCKELLTSVRKIAPASSMSYGSFPLPNCAWPRTEGGFEARYAYCVNNAEVSLRTGAIRADRRFLAESAGDHLDAACQAASWRLCGFFASKRSPLSDHLLYTVLPTAPYFHFVIEHIGALIATLKAYPDACVILNADAWHGYYRDYVELLKEAEVVKDSVVLSPGVYQIQNCAFTAKELDAGMFRQETVKSLREIFGKGAFSSRQDKRIFITRKGTRIFDNQYEVEQVAIDCGFEVIDTEGLSVAQQIQLFAESSFIVANHGAGLTNLLWCREGTRVLELFSPLCLNDCYFRLSRICNLRYGCLIGEKSSSWGAIDVSAVKEIMESGKI